MADVETDVVILGAGSAGEHLASLLGKAGVDVVVVEERLVGGECPFFACVPSKAMVISAEARHMAVQAAEVSGVVDALDIGEGAAAFVKAAARRDAIAAHHDDAEHARGLHDAGAQLIRGRGTVVGPDMMAVTDEDGTTEVAFRRLVLATGTAPKIPPIDGLDDVGYWTFEDAWTATERPQSLLVIGGGAVGCEIAQVYARFGAGVTLVEVQRLMTGREEPEITDGLVAALEHDMVQVREGASLDSVRRDEGGSVVATIDGQEHFFEQVVVAAGMAPRLEGLGLEALGLDTDGLDVDDHGRVDGRDDVWAVGDLTGVAPFTHTANYQAKVVAENLRGGDRAADYRAIPRTVYTRPELAAVGHTRASAAEAGIDAAAIAFDLGDTARAHVEDVLAGDLVLVADRADGTLIGASLVAPAAGESIGEFALAIHERTSVAALADVVHPFPTWAEGFGPAIDSLLRELEG